MRNNNDNILNIILKNLRGSFDFHYVFFEIFGAWEVIDEAIDPIVVQSKKCLKISWWHLWNNISLNFDHFLILSENITNFWELRWGVNKVLNLIKIRISLVKELSCWKICNVILVTIFVELLQFEESSGAILISC